MSGLRRRPLWLSAFGVALCLNTLGMPVQAMLLFGHPPGELAAVWAKLTLSNKTVMFLSPLAGAGVLGVCRWGWHATLLLLAVGVVNNVAVLLHPTPYPPALTGCGTALLVALALGLLRPATGLLFRSRHLHWWKTPPRYRLPLPVELDQGPAGTTRGRARDVSRTGLFLEGVRSGLTPGAQVTLRLRFEERVIRCAATVVRCVADGGGDPAGVGLCFASLRLPDRLWLRFRLKRAATG